MHARVGGMEIESWIMKPIRSLVAIVFLLTFACFGATCRAEDGHEGWLRYAPVDRAAAPRYASLPKMVVVYGGESAVLPSAREELTRGLRGMLGVMLSAGASNHSNGPAIVLGTLSSLGEHAGKVAGGRELGTDGFWLRSATFRGSPSLMIIGASDRGVLYGVFALLS